MKAMVYESAGEKEEAITTCIKIKLREGVTRINMTSLFLVQFVVCLLLTLQTVFVTYLLEQVFNITGSETAKVVGDLGFVSEIGVLCTELFLGYSLDLFGRKRLTVIGLLISGVAIAMQPLPANLTGLYILRTIASIGVVPALYTPYTIDYVRKGSLGLIAGYYTVNS